MEKRQAVAKLDQLMKYDMPPGEWRKVGDDWWHTSGVCASVSDQGLPLVSEPGGYTHEFYRWGDAALNINAVAIENSKRL